MAMFVSGTVKGIKVQERVNKETGEVKKVYYVGLSEMVPDDYDECERVTEIRISDRLAKSGLQAKFEALKGKDVLVEVFIMANVFKGKAYTNLYFAGDGVPMPAPKRQAA